jgi:branched-chain amino acid transport system substrate-binding protein
MRRAILVSATALLIGCMPVLAGNESNLKIGVLEDFSGPYSDLGGRGTVVAVQMAIDDMGGKIGGRAIELVSADHQNKAEIGGSIARKWFDVDGIEAIFGVPNSSVAIAVQQLAREKRKIFAFTAVGADLTGQQCSSFGSAWNLDTYSAASVIGRSLSNSGSKTWYVLAVDYTFGQQLERDLTKAVTQNGGLILGRARHPLNTSDFASFVLQAQASGAEVVALANAGRDMTTAIKQASEFGLRKSQKLAALTMFITDIHSMGLDAAQGLIHASGFYWDRDARSREFSARFAMLHNGVPPTEVQASMYSAALHYLKAVAGATSSDAIEIAKIMKSTPISDAVIPQPTLRGDGRLMKPLHIVQVKSPTQSTRAWDYVTIVDTVAAEDAFKPLEDGGCELK